MNTSQRYLRIGFNENTIKAAITPNVIYPEPLLSEFIQWLIPAAKDNQARY